ncbi:MAG: indole-3-glycerol phosphate synthase TrpC [Acidobacteria bacterium]|nr:indole-3-glycerol phosphate synthase TrpC [Acidobacteriota bacterium]
MTMLSEMVAATRRRLYECRSLRDVRALERQACRHSPRGFKRSLEQAAATRIAVIAELKKASPSRGLIRAEFDCARLAREFETGGACALSILTNQEYFQGSLENLRTASAASELPCLRKDFIVDEIQLLEARANSADAVLLIARTLAGEDLSALIRRAKDLELDVLCEVHDRRELECALEAGCKLVGINNRNLETFDVDLETGFQLAPHIPSDVLAVAESGIESGADIARLRQAGYRGFLIGESLMRAEEPGKALAVLLAEAAAAGRALV